VQDGSWLVLFRESRGIAQCFQGIAVHEENRRIDEWATRIEEAMILAERGLGSLLFVMHFAKADPRGTEVWTVAEPQTTEPTLTEMQNEESQARFPC
jgi:hypothetical protein